MAKLVTLRIVVPRWRAAVVQVWIRALVVTDFVLPGIVDFDGAVERMARFACRVKVDG